MPTESDSSSNNTAPLLGVTGKQVKSVTPFICESFSFRGAKESQGNINICPSSVRNALIGQIDKDVSISNTAKAFKKIMDNIPAVQVREYSQDSRVVQIQNAFKAFKRGWKVFEGVTDNDGTLWGEITELFKNLPGFIKTAFAEFSAFEKGVDPQIFSSNEDLKAFVFNIPFILYYELMSSKTTGFYLLPYSGKLVDSSNGTVGWNTQHGFNGLNTSQFSMIGTAINFFGKNIKLNTTPTWDGNTSNDYPAMEVSFELFNDDVTSSVNNYMFVNQLLAKNRFLQYHIYQHNPCVYDVKIEGYGRFYMCSANITCDYKGVSRKPSESFYKKLLNYISEGYSGYLSKDNLILEKLVRIPDVYSIKITFTSLLPNSMNNFLFRFSGNTGMEDNYGNSFGDKDYSEMLLKSMDTAMNDAIGPNLKTMLAEMNKAENGSNGGSAQS